jgi:hypothetical protein
MHKYTTGLAKRGKEFALLMSGCLRVGRVGCEISYDQTSNVVTRPHNHFKRRHSPTHLLRCFAVWMGGDVYIDPGMKLKFVLFSSLVPLAYPLPQVLPLSPLVTTDTLHNYLRREFSSLERGDKTNAEEEEIVEGRWKAKLNRMKENSQMKIGSFPSGMGKDDEIRRLAKNRKNDGAGKNGKSDKGKKNGEDKSDKGEGKGKDDKGKSKNGKADEKSNGKNDKKEKKNDKKEKKDKNDKGKDNNSPSTVTPPSRTLDLSLSTCDLYCDGLDAFCESLEDCCEEGFAVCDAAVFDEPGYYHCGAKTEYLGRCVEDEVIQHVVNGKSLSPPPAHFPHSSPSATM